MIKNSYAGNLGNYLFQYFAARLLAEEHGLEFEMEPIEGFPRTKDKVSGLRFSKLKTFPDEMMSYALISEAVGIAKSEEKGVALNHFYGYNYRDYYENNLDKACEWFQLDKSIKTTHDIGVKDLLISVRNGDFITKRVNLPFEYYKSILESNLIDYDNLYIVSDDFNDPFMENFAPYNPIYIDEHYLCQFKTALNFKYVIGSHSTFCWFHILLNQNLTKCFFPVITSTHSSAWSERMIYKNNFDLRIDKPYMEYVYNVPRQLVRDQVVFDEGDWFGDEKDYRNSFLREKHFRDKTDEILDYHKESKYRFMKFKKAET